MCQQPGLSLWVPFQNAATAVTNLYKGKDNLAALLIKGEGQPASGFQSCVPSVLATFTRSFLLPNPTTDPEYFAIYKLRLWSGWITDFSRGRFWAFNRPAPPAFDNALGAFLNVIAGEVEG